MLISRHIFEAAAGLIKQKQGYCSCWCWCWCCQCHNPTKTHNPVARPCSTDTHSPAQLCIGTLSLFPFCVSGRQSYCRCPCQRSYYVVLSVEVRMAHQVPCPTEPQPRNTAPMKIQHMCPLGRSRASGGTCYDLCLLIDKIWRVLATQPTRSAVEPSYCYLEHTC